MTNYRYYSADLLTGDVIAELPLYGTFFSKRLSGAGNGTGTFKLDTGKHNDTELLQGTDPGKVCIYCERDGSLIWGGPVWSRTYAAQSKTVQITMQTFESIFDHVVLQSDFVKQNVDQLVIFKDLIDLIQGQEANDFGFDTSLIGTSGVLRTSLVPAYEYHYAQEVVSNIVGVDNGFDYTIDVRASAVQDKPDKVVLTGYPQLGQSGASSALVFDYPGNIANYWWPESGSRAGTKFALLGRGAGITMLRAEAVATDLIASGYPAWWVVRAMKNVGDLPTLIGLAAAERDKSRMPISVPTFEIKPDRIPPFESWSALGVNFEAHIEDARFPDGKDVTSRMTGWELSVADTDSSEILKFIIEGEGDSG